MTSRLWATDQVWHTLAETEATQKKGTPALTGKKTTDSHCESGRHLRSQIVEQLESVPTGRRMHSRVVVVGRGHVDDAAQSLVAMIITREIQLIPGDARGGTG